MEVFALDLTTISYPPPSKKSFVVATLRCSNVRISTTTILTKGTFVCKYVGNLYNSEDGNVEGQKHGDDYFCELDLIELVEREKVGWNKCSAAS